MIGQRRLQSNQYALPKPAKPNLIRTSFLLAFRNRLAYHRHGRFQTALNL